MILDQVIQVVASHARGIAISAGVAGVLMWLLVGRRAACCVLRCVLPAKSGDGGRWKLYRL